MISNEGLAPSTKPRHPPPAAEHKPPQGQIFQGQPVDPQLRHNLLPLQQRDDQVGRPHAGAVPLGTGGRVLVAREAQRQAREARLIRPQQSPARGTDRPPVRLGEAGNDDEV